MKKQIILSLLCVLGWANLCLAQQVKAPEKFQLSSHILDITKGQPAAGVTIRLSKLVNGEKWVKVDEKVTDRNGRIKDFLKDDGRDNSGVYKLTYYTQPYFQRLKEDTFYPFIEVVFEIKGKQHFHVPITLSPYGYSTYRGN